MWMEQCGWRKVRSRKQISGDYEYNMVEKQLISKRDGKKGKDALLSKLVDEKVVIDS